MGNMMNEKLMTQLIADFQQANCKAGKHDEKYANDSEAVTRINIGLAEEAIAKAWDKHFIVRTSWLYSEFAQNFMKTMLRLAKERDTLGVVNDQTGTPTYAVDLAEALVQIMKSNSHNYGIYHYSNEGVASWYDFAKRIFELNNVSIKLNPILTSQFPTPAKRPLYSVLDKSKIKSVFKIAIKNWEDALESVPKA